MKPQLKPRVPLFSSGPCAKRPGWAPAVLADAALGRSHRAKHGKAKLAAVIERTPAILGIPADYRLGIVPARSEEHTSALQSLMRHSSAVFCLQKKPTP